MRFKIVHTTNIHTEFEADDEDFNIFMKEIKEFGIARVPNTELPKYVVTDNIVYISRTVDIP